MKKNITILIIILLLSPLIFYALALVIPNYNSYVVTSGSMEPEIPKQSIIYTLKVSSDNINVGDTVTYEQDGLIITHKVIEKTEENGGASYTTKGVNNAVPDAQPVTHDQVQGKKILGVPYYGHFPQFLSTTQGLFVFVILPAAALILIEVSRIISEIK